ncbi:MAG TPA: hypothetical protein VNN10_00695 [Dehalococcoidia bacterium]|nr:hypothetical protein [Dehalococcoidia bacterium]
MFNEQTGRVYSLVEAPDAEAPSRDQRKAHGLVADGIVEVREGS